PFRPPHPGNRVRKADRWRELFAPARLALPVHEANPPASMMRRRQGTTPMQVLTRTQTVANGTTGLPVVAETMPFLANVQAGDVIGLVEPDAATATNEHVMVRVPLARRGQAVRGRFVGIEDLVHGMRFLGRVVGGPFYPDGPDCDVRVRVEVQ